METEMNERLEMKKKATVESDLHLHTHFAENESSEDCYRIYV